MLWVGSLVLWSMSAAPGLGPGPASPGLALRVQRDPETGAFVYRPASRPLAPAGTGVQRVVQPDGTVIYVFGAGTQVQQTLGPAVLDRRTLSDGTVVYDFGPASFVEMRARRGADGRIDLSEGQGAAPHQRSGVP